MAVTKGEDKSLMTPVVCGCIRPLSQASDGSGSSALPKAKFPVPRGIPVTMSDTNKPSALDLSGNVSENWWKFRQNFDISRLASGKSEKPSEVKAAILLNLVGEDAVEVFNTFNLSDDDRKQFDAVIAAFKMYASEKRNVLYERFVLYSRKQKEGEPFQQFITDLKKLVRSCEFGSQTDEIIRNCVFMGVRDKTLQKEMLPTKYLTLEKACDLAKLAEISDQQLQGLQSTETQKSSVTPEWGASVEVNTVQHKAKWNKESPKYSPQTSLNLVKLPDSVDLESPTARKDWEVFEGDFENYLIATGQDEGPDKVKIALLKNMLGSQGRALFETFDIPPEDKLVYSKVKEAYRVFVAPKTNPLYERFVFNQHVQLEGETFDHFLTDCRRLIKTCGYERPVSQEENMLVDRIVQGIRDSSVRESLLRLDNATLTKVAAHCRLMEQSQQQAKEIQARSSTHDSVSCDFVSTKDRKSSRPRQNSKFGDNVCRINIRDHSNPVCKPPRRVPRAIRPALKQELDRLEQKGIICKVDKLSASAWVSNLVVVEKSSGKLRLCLDPTDLNKVVIRDYHEIPTLEEMSEKLTGKKFYSVFDLKEGFHQVQLDEDSSHKCCFSTPFGCYRYLRMPYGIANAPENFQKFIEENFASIPGVVTFFDDILCTGETEGDHDTCAQQVVERAASLGIKFNPDKLQYKVSEVRYVGQIFSAAGMSPDPERIRALTSLQAPSNRKELQRMSSVCSPLYELLKADVDWLWLPCHEEAFCKLKSLITSAPVLATFDPTNQLVIQCDASQSGLGATLFQEGPKGLHPVHIASRSLTAAEKSYSQIEKELLAVSFASAKFHYYIYEHVVRALMSKEKQMRDVYNKTARRQEITFVKGETVVVKTHKHDKWEPGVIVGKHSSPRSYWVRGSGDRIVRRNVIHLRKTTTSQKPHQSAPRLLEVPNTKTDGEEGNRLKQTPRTSSLEPDFRGFEPQTSTNAVTDVSTVQGDKSQEATDSSGHTLATKSGREVKPVKRLNL
ncbi:uncharacterized protein LOC134533454 [Bacillus rossius redtenbacheri]|uniref:uncharacterized protein LOC134533454 n=1 Tax=Bacillus rossius redtenbacheri TaxID=93214 RepID=UPI002FDC90C7